MIQLCNVFAVRKGEFSLANTYKRLNEEIQLEGIFSLDKLICQLSARGVQ